MIDICLSHGPHMIPIDFAVSGLRAKVTVTWNIKSLSAQLLETY